MEVLGGDDERDREISCTVNTEEIQPESNKHLSEPISR